MMRAPRVAGGRGMVLIAVLWMVAALSLLVVGLTRAVRDETRMLARNRLVLVGGGVGDAAIHMVLQKMVQESRPVNRLLHVDTRYQDIAVRVRIMPLNGLIDINSAPLPLLATLYAVGGGVPRGAAESLAQTTVEVRTRRDSAGQDEGFEAPEDLMRVPGVDYSLYAKLSALITADVRGSGKVNPMAAPAEVLAVLTGGNVAVAGRIAASRDAGQEGVDTTMLDPSFVDMSATQRFQLDAMVPLSDGTWLQVTRGVDVRNFPQDGLPWRTFRTDRVVRGTVGNQF